MNGKRTLFCYHFPYWPLKHIHLSLHLLWITRYTQLHTQQEPSTSTTTNDALTDNRAPKACTGISKRSSSAVSGKSDTVPSTSSVKPIKGKKPKVLIIGDSMIKEIEAKKLSKTQSITKSCIPGATVVKIRDQLVSTFIEDSGYDHVIIHAG